MNRRGIAPLIIVVIIVVVAVVAGVGIYVVTRGGGGPGGLSLYSGSQSWEIPSSILGSVNIPSGIDYAGYTVSGASVQDVLNWYKGQMTGWTLENEVPITSSGGMEIGGLIYRNGNNGAGIVVMSGTGLSGTCYILATGPWSTLSGGGEVAGGGGGGGITGATSLQFNISEIYGGVTTITGTFMAKDIGTSNLKIRFEGTLSGQSMTLVANGAQQTVWVENGGVWTDLSENFSAYENTWGTVPQTVKTDLSGWTSGTYTSPDGTVTISNIQVNPTLDDSLFVHVS